MLVQRPPGAQYHLDTVAAVNTVDVGGAASAAYREDSSSGQAEPASSAKRARCERRRWRALAARHRGEQATAEMRAGAVLTTVVTATGQIAQGAVTNHGRTHRVQGAVALTVGSVSRRIGPELRHFHWLLKMNNQSN